MENWLFFVPLTAVLWLVVLIIVGIVQGAAIRKDNKIIELDDVVKITRNDIVVSDDVARKAEQIIDNRKKFLMCLDANLCPNCGDMLGRNYSEEEFLCELCGFQHNPFRKDGSLWEK